MTAVTLAWGAAGARSLAADCEVLVLVDVLSFTTAVSVATSRGAAVRPIALDDRVVPEPGDFVAAPRAQDLPSLSPVSLLQLQPGQRLVLPSPNGAAIAAGHSGVPIVAGCLRNAAAVARWVEARGSVGAIGIVAAGEHDDDGVWRPAYEDLVGAGAVIARLGGSRTTPAEAAAATYLDARDDMTARLLDSRSGRELVERGFAADVELAAQSDVDDVVPMLADGVFVGQRPL